MDGAEPVSFLLSLGGAQRRPVSSFERAGRARGRRDFRFAGHFRKLSDEREKTAKIKYFPEILKILK
jgi:hypothetical protein